MITIEFILLAGSLLVLFSVVVARFFENLGVPVLLLFLLVGLMVGPEGPGTGSVGALNDAASIAALALMLILFAAGFDTRWTSVRPVLWQGMALSTAGVVLTAGAVGIFAMLVFDVSIVEGLLLGSIISSTDAAAVFSVLRSKNIRLKGQVGSLLELESASNDPMAVFLTMLFLEVLQSAQVTTGGLIMHFALQMGLGGVIGFAVGKGLVLLVNRIRFSNEAFYLVFTLAAVAFTFSITAVIGGSGYLAVYIAGLIMGNSDIVQKKSLLRFFDGLAWLSQIVMFLALGLLAAPGRVLSMTPAGLLVSGFLILVARPAVVFLMLIPWRVPWRVKAFVSWVGLRGAVPIILATFPMMAGLPRADLIFNLVFFIVLTSALLQGWSVPLAARVFRLEGGPAAGVPPAMEFSGGQPADSELVDFIVPYESDVTGKAIVELGLPRDCLIVLITRNDVFVVPSGGTVLEAGDALLVLVNTRSLPDVRRIFSSQKA